MVQGALVEKADVRIRVVLIARGFEPFLLGSPVAPRESSAWEFWGQH